MQNQSNQPPENVFLDNPLEVEKLPSEPLSFEFVAQVEEGDVWEPIVVTVGTVVLLVTGIFIISSMAQTYLDFAQSYQSIVTVIVSILVVGWTVNRKEFSKHLHPLVGLTLAVLAVFLAVVLGVNSKLIRLASGVMLFYSTGELAIHWAIVRERGFNPIPKPTPNAKAAHQPHMTKELDYAEMMVPVGIVAFIFSNADLISGGNWVLLGIAFLVWLIACEKCKARNVPVLGTLKFAVERAYLYPDNRTIAIGLLRSPMVIRPLRAIPAGLFLGCCLSANVRVLYELISAVGGDTPWDALRIAAELACQLAVAPALLLGLWTLMASELSYEF